MRLARPNRRRAADRARELNDWAVACAASWVTCLDNVSALPEWLSDAICKAVTGDGLLRRQLYTDSDVAVLAFRRVVTITTIDPGPLRGDLADRLLRIELQPIKESGRKSDEELAAAWAAIHPRMLGALLDFTAKVLRVLPTIRHHTLPRLADFGRMLLAVDEVLDSNAYQRFTELAQHTAESVAEADPVLLALTAAIPTDRWQGTAAALLQLLTPEHPPRGWPTTPAGMAARLKRAAPTLRQLGWTVTQSPRTDKKGSRGWAIQRPGAQETRT